MELLGIDEDVARMAQRFARIQVMWMFPAFMNRCVQSYQRAQRIVQPIARMSVISFAAHVPTCWWLVENYGFEGAAWALPINQWVLLISVLVYSKYKGLNERCWGGWSRDCLSGWLPLLRLAAAGTIAVMGEWWSWGEYSNGLPQPSRRAVV